MQAIKCVVLGDGAVGKLSKIMISVFFNFSDWRYQFKPRIYKGRIDGDSYYTM